MDKTEIDYYLQRAKAIRFSLWRRVYGVCIDSFMSDEEKREFIESFWKIPRYEENQHQDSK